MEVWFGLVGIAKDEDRASTLLVAPRFQQTAMQHDNALCMSASMQPDCFFLRRHVMRCVTSKVGAGPLLLAIIRYGCSICLTLYVPVLDSLGRGMTTTKTTISPWHLPKSNMLTLPQSR